MYVPDSAWSAQQGEGHYRRPRPIRCLQEDGICRRPPLRPYCHASDGPDDIGDCLAIRLLHRFNPAFRHWNDGSYNEW